MKRMNKQGFTMVELLVVLVIVAILAAVATPIYIGNTNRAKASEAVAVMSQIRQAMREFNLKGQPFFNIPAATDIGNIQNAFPTGVTAAGVPSPGGNGIGMNLGVTQYFSNGAFTVVSTGTTATDAQFTLPDPQGFVITVTGAAGANRPCTDTIVTNCALKGSDTAVVATRLKMDNTGRTVVSYDGGSNWENY